MEKEASEKQSVSREVSLKIVVFPSINSSGVKSNFTRCSNTKSTRPRLDPSKRMRYVNHHCSISTV